MDYGLKHRSVGGAWGQKRTLPGDSLISAKCQERTFSLSVMAGADNQRARNESAIVSLSQGRAGVTKSIRSIYADYGTQ
jgi:hypothetical protein